MAGNILPFSHVARPCNHALQAFGLTEMSALKTTTASLLFFIMPSDYYKTLGIEKSASADEIKSAYRKLAHEYHPDKKGGNEAKFKEINEAYQVLSDPKKRGQYDQFGSTFQNGQGFGGFGGQGQQGGFDGFDFSQFGGFGRGENIDLNDIFDIFGGGFGRRSSRRAEANINRGADIEVALTIDFFTCARGGVKKVELSKEIICENCQGSGVKPGSNAVNCGTCNGTGEIKQNVHSFFGNIMQVYACKVCTGTGKVPKEKCPICSGEGRAKGRKTFDITIPGGIKDREVLVVKGQGQAGFRNGQAGDLYIRLQVLNDRRFKRVGEDLFYNLNIKLTDAMLGNVVRVPTLDGDKEIQIPAGTQDGEEIRMRGFGVHGNRNGDQIVKIKIDIPKKLSSRARKLVEELSTEI
jgi:molecular chaperone DnaJ